MNSTKIVLAAIVVINTALTIWGENRRSHQKEGYFQQIEEIKQAREEVKKKADSLISIQWGKVELLKAQRAIDSARYVSLEIKLNNRIHELEQNIQTYRRRVVDLGDLPIY